MPGTPLNLDLPTLSDTFSTIVSKLVTAVSAIEDDLGPRVTSGELNLTSEVNLNGNALVNVGGVRLTGGSSTVEGTLYLEDDELWVMTAAGAVRLTSDGTINVAGAGTIGGDYGGVNPATVVFVDSAGQYVFREDTGVYADLVADDLVLRGDTGLIRFSAHAGLSGTREISVKTLPTSGVSNLVYSSADSTLEDGAVVRATNEALFTDLDCTGTLTTDIFKHGDMTFVVPLTLFRAGYTLSASQGSDATFSSYTNIQPGGAARWPIEGLRVGDRVKTVKVTGNSPTASSPVVTVGTSTSAGQTSHTYTGTGNFGVDGYFSMELDTPVTLAQTDTLWISVVGGEVNMRHAVVIFDRP